MVNVPLLIGFHTSQVVQDFSHQQYGQSNPNQVLVQVMMTTVHQPDLNPVTPQLVQDGLSGVQGELGKSCSFLGTLPQAYLVGG